ncbi:MAG: class I SAM-dependent methyltransferase [Actinomycetes bacterium]
MVRRIKRAGFAASPQERPASPAPAAPRRKREIDRIDDLHAFWRQPAPAGNSPGAFVPPVGRSKVLLELLSDLPTDARILEVGCNVGRNLAHLYDHGYHHLEGVEISPHAVELLRKTYPQIADVPVHLGPAEDVLPGMATDSFDLVFTMAVIEHIHPDSSAVFDHMVRIGRSILSIEPPGRRSHRQYPHDVPEVFRTRGMTLVTERPMSDFSETREDRGIRVYSAYRFQRGS